MPNVNLYNMKGENIGTIDLAETVFGAEINTSAMHSYVVAYLANQRQGTQSAKTRAEVSGGGKKPWRQKGTGRARQGSTRSPQWTHGGVVFAPKPRDYRLSLNKKLKRVALASALSSKVADEKIIVVDSIEMNEIKT
ncbi:MAG: 50S ribosomal protein L4, partial [Clostridia bacterium]|nr:50S ribosomal protein L4 [Clostridia bacterium]